MLSPSPAGSASAPPRRKHGIRFSHRLDVGTVPVAPAALVSLPCARLGPQVSALVHEHTALVPGRDFLSQGY